MATPHPPPTNKPAVAALNVYKKVAIIRKADDVLTYEDAEGNVKTVSDLHLAAAATVSALSNKYMMMDSFSHFVFGFILSSPASFVCISSSKTPINKTKPKDDIPVPKIRNVETYQTDIPNNYECPVAFVRYLKPSNQELRDNLEYVVDAEDEVWLINNKKFGRASSLRKSNQLEEESTEQTTVQLPLDMLEIMMDILEKATAHETIIRIDQAEHLILQRLPQLYHMYPIKAKAGMITLKHVLTDVYTYWVQKRSKLKRPLLRRFWPVTSTDDTNPHLVFRPREKEKYKLRKKRQNDIEAFKKMEQLRQDFAQVATLCDFVKQREELNRSIVLLQREWFQQRLYEAIDTSGRPRISKHVDKNDLNTLMRVGRPFDAQDAWKAKKPRTGSNTSIPQPQSSSTATSRRFESSFSSMDGIGGSSADSSKKPLIIAGQNHGEPAPNFLNPLETRESYRTTWEGVPPHVTTFIDAQPVPTFRFRHRPRVGRGGRLCIDRLPLPPNPNAPTFFRAAGATMHQEENKAQLLDLLPPPLDRDRISQRIEAISLNALKEDYEGGVTGPESEENDGEIVLVPIKDWLSTDDQLWGEERYSIGPI